MREDVGINVLTGPSIERYHSFPSSFHFVGLSSKFQNLRTIKHSTIVSNCECIFFFMLTC
jgi:hypothetical protein